jgi:sporulation protein YlmC with PRC-barrel domain
MTYLTYENMSAELRLKKLRGSGGFVMARVTDEQQSKGNLGGPDLFLAPVGRLESEKISKYTCNTCEKEFEGSPNIEFENPNEEVAENLVLVERGKYLCNECGSTIAEYRDFRKPDEQVDVGLANSIEQQQETSFSDFDTSTQQEIVQPEMSPEPTPSGGIFRSIFGMDVFDESAKRIGKAKQVGVDSNQELVLLVSDASGNDININWSRIGTVGEVIFLGKSDKVDVKIENTTEVGKGSRCSNCNFDNKPDSRFCESCGNQI